MESAGQEVTRSWRISGYSISKFTPLQTDSGALMFSGPCVNVENPQLHPCCIQTAGLNQIFWNLVCEKSHELLLQKTIETDFLGRFNWCSDRCVNRTKPTHQVLSFCDVTQDDQRPCVPPESALRGVKLYCDGASRSRRKQQYLDRRGTWLAQSECGEIPAPFRPTSTLDDNMWVNMWPSPSKATRDFDTC